MPEVSAGLLWDIFKHAQRWLANLYRASEERKQQSIKALRRVISASRETSVYIRKMQDTKSRDHAVEGRLSSLWTELGFELEDLGMEKLAKRCQIKGKHWSNPEHYDQAFLEKADLSLDQMETLALQIMREVEGKKSADGERGQSTPAGD